MAASAGLFHSTALTEDGALWTCGDGDDRKLGHRETRWVPKRWWRKRALGTADRALAGFGGGRIGRWCGRWSARWRLPWARRLCAVADAHCSVLAAESLAMMLGHGLAGWILLGSVCELQICMCAVAAWGRGWCGCWVVALVGRMEHARQRERKSFRQVIQQRKVQLR